MTTYTVKVFSATLEVDVLAEKLDAWEKEYEDHKQSGPGLKYLVYCPQKKEKEEQRS